MTMTTTMTTSTHTTTPEPEPIIDPTKVTDFDRTDSELESFWLFAIFTSGKNADFASRCLTRILTKHPDKTPFEIFRSMSELEIRNTLVAAKTGQYDRISKAVVQSLGLDLRNATLDELLAVHGVGPKTARFFILHSRENAKHAVLDTHILAWMRTHGLPDAPKITPQNPKVYAGLESTFIDMVRVWFPSMPIAFADLLIWSSQSGRTSDEFVG